MAIVRLENVSKSFGRTDILKNITLDISANALTVIVGPSGCGKSTLLRIIAGLEEPTSGDVYIGADKVTEVPPFQRRVGMVFQSYALYPHMTVSENLRFGMSALKLSNHEQENRIQWAAELLALTPYLDRKPKQLSGGQRQRVAMGRALVKKPKVFLFDEPLSNLDASLRTRMRVEIARFRSQLEATAIYVTHDQVEAMTLAHQIVVLRNGEIEQIGSPLEIYRSPKNKFVASFLGAPAMNFIPLDFFDAGKAKTSSESTLSARLDGHPVQGEWDFGIRPENLCLNQTKPCRIKAKVFAVENLGDQSLVHLQLQEFFQGGNKINIVARHTGACHFKVEDEIYASFDPLEGLLFGANEKRVSAELSC